MSAANKRRNFIERKKRVRNYRQIALFVEVVQLDQAKKKARFRAFFRELSNYQSLLPPPIPSNINRLWKMLYMLKYKESVALM